MQASVARCLRTPPVPAKALGLDFGLATAYAATATGARLSLATVLCEPVTVASCRAKATPLHVRRSCFGPMVPQRGCLVEPPGTAPGSDPLIPRAFMSIVPEGTR